MSQQSFVVMGGSDESNKDYSLLRRLSRGRPKTQDGWGCHRETRKGAELWFYITAPVSAIVAVGTALRDAKKGDSWPYDTIVGNIAWIESHISKGDLCRMFPDWDWAKYTRGKVRLDNDKAAALRARMRNSDRVNAQRDHVISGQGAGFGDPKKNRKVELAAIGFAKRSYEQEGFKVTSVESKNLGYDLVASRGSLKLHLEVKGVSGDSPEFIITENELQCARTDEDFRLVVVLNALAVSREKQVLTGREFKARYKLKALAHRAVRR
jgi:hypothetical protein